MAIDPRTPVIIGVGQLTQRTDEGDPALEPVDMMVEALRRAATDSGGRGVLEAAREIEVVRLVSWRYGDPGALVAERLGLARSQVRTVTTNSGGNIVGHLMATIADGILAGEKDVVLLSGAEAWRTISAHRRDGTTPDWTVQPEGTEPDAVVGGDLDMYHPAELAREIRRPIEVYPLLENAIRVKAGRSLSDHRQVLGRLMAGFSAVAAANPYAWERSAISADDIVTPSPTNRMIGFPYTKLLCSNEMVDEAAAVILCSAGTARSLGVPEDRWVFPLAAAEAKAPAVSERHDLWSSPTVAAAGRTLWELSGMNADDVAHVDLYSCFPSAVQVQASELGFGLDRPLTVTGGMRFAGGPWNNYPMHAVATMVQRLREDAGAVGLCSANGGYVSKQATSLFSTTPAAGGYRHASAQAEADAQPRRQVDLEPSGPATIESYTVMHDRSGPERAILACLRPDGRRAWGIVTETAAMAEMEIEDPVGRKVELRPDGAAALV